MYVASVIWMLHMFHTYMLQMFYLDVVYVRNDFQVFLGVFVSVLDECCKCFSYFRTYIASVASECCEAGASVRAGKAEGARAVSAWGVRSGVQARASGCRESVQTSRR
jgi:hypothetical protein